MTCAELGLCAARRLQQAPAETRIAAARAEVAGVGLQAFFGLDRRDAAHLHHARDGGRHEGHRQRRARGDPARRRRQIDAGGRDVDIVAGIGMAIGIAVERDRRHRERGVDRRRIGRRPVRPAIARRRHQDDILVGQHRHRIEHHGVLRRRGDAGVDHGHVGSHQPIDRPQEVGAARHRPALAFLEDAGMEQGGAAQQPCDGRPVRFPDQHRRDRGAVRGIGGRRLAGGEAAPHDDCALQRGMIEIGGTVDHTDAHARAHGRAISLPADRCQHPLPVVEMAAAGACIGREVERIVERDDRLRKFRAEVLQRIRRAAAARRRDDHQRQRQRVEPLDAFDGETAGGEVRFKRTRWVGDQKPIGPRVISDPAGDGGTGRKCGERQEYDKNNPSRGDHVDPPPHVSPVMAIQSWQSIGCEKSRAFGWFPALAATSA